MCVFAAIDTRAQGTVDFTNWVPYSRPPVDAPFFDLQGVPLAGPGYVAQLYAGIMPDPLSPVEAPVPFASHGYFYGNSELAIPFIVPGYPAWVHVRAWEVVGGSSFENAALAGGWTSVSKILYLPFTGREGGGVPVLPAFLFGLEFPGAPVIVQQPQPQTVREGETATLSVIASSGAPQSYQWYVGSSGDTNGLIAGATNPTYAPVLGIDLSFWVKVSNMVGATESASAKITLVSGDAARLTLRLESGVPHLTIDSSYSRDPQRIEYATNLAARGWMPLTTVFFTSNLFTFVDTEGTNSPRRFYRAVALLPGFPR